MAEIKEIRDAIKKRKRARLIRRIAISVIVISLAIVIIINKDNLTPEAISNWLSGTVMQSGEGGFPVKMPSGEVVSLETLGSDIALTNQTNVYFYSSRGNQMRSVQHARKNVQAKAAGNNLLVYSVGAQEASVETTKKTAATLKTEKPIITGEVCKNGGFVIATQSDVYTSEMKVYDKNANAIFKWTPSVGVISALSISPDGNRVAAATLYTQGGKIMSGIHFFSTSKSEALFSYKIENQIVRSLSCDKNGVTVITDMQYTRLDETGSVVGSFSFNEKKLVDISVISGGHSLVFEDVNDPNKSVLCTLSSKAELKAEANVPENIIDMAASGDNVYLISETGIFLYEASTGIRRDECAIEDDAQRVCAGSSDAYVITAASQMIKADVKN